MNFFKKIDKELENFILLDEEAQKSKSNNFALKISAKLEDYLGKQVIFPEGDYESSDSLIGRFVCYDGECIPQVVQAIRLSKHIVLLQDCAGKVYCAVY